MNRKDVVLKKLFVKVSLPSEDVIQSYVSDYGLDEIELKAYKEILPELMKFEKHCLNTSTLHDMIPKVSKQNYTYPSKIQCILF